MTDAELSSAFKFWTAFGVVGCVIVILGIIGEGFELIEKWWKKRKFRVGFGVRFDNLNRARLSALIRRFRKFDLEIETFAIALVAIGLIIEVAASHVAYGISDLQNTALNKEAGDARVVAGNAERDAGQANERASKFEKEAGELFKIGEQAKESTTNALEELEKAKTEREKAESGRLELEKQVLALVKKTNVRNISLAAKTNLALQLKGVPKGNVEIIMSDRDAECMAFGLEIKKSLVSAGFIKVDFSPRDIFRAVEMFPEAANSGTDLIFCVKDSSSPPLCAKLTLLCLKNGGINAEGWPYIDTLSQNDFQIWVLPKPIPLDK